MDPCRFLRYALILFLLSNRTLHAEASLDWEPSRTWVFVVGLLEQTRKGDLLVFYFCGHGSRDRKSGETWFANYDAADKNSSAWSVPGIFATMKEHFHGSRALLLADCCHSGALYDLTQRHKDSEISHVVVTSLLLNSLGETKCGFSGLRIKNGIPPRS